MAETATAAAKEDTGRKWEQKKFICVCVLSHFLYARLLLLFTFILSMYFMLGVKMNFDKNFREIDNTNT